jgi:pilus assembly protein CpaC
VTILSEPNLTALSGETASFHSGGQFPIETSQITAAGNTIVDIVFYDFGISLEFTPTVIGKSRINLRVRPEVSTLDFSIARNGVPGLSTRRADTAIELASGQSFVIAGLLSEASSENIHKTPGLGDIPILGDLFRSEQFRRDETELIIVVTPYLVRPVSNERIPLPTDPFMRGLPIANGNAQGGSTLSKYIPVPSGTTAVAGQLGSPNYILD